MSLALILTVMPPVMVEVLVWSALLPLHIADAPELADQRTSPSENTCTLSGPLVIGKS